MPELIPANIIIGDRSYRLKIEPADEELVRKTVKLINDKIVEFKTNFAGKDMQDYIAMVLIWFATEQIKSNGSYISDKTNSTQLNAIESLLNKTLSKP